MTEYRHYRPSILDLIPMDIQAASNRLFGGSLTPRVLYIQADSYGNAGFMVELSPSLMSRLAMMRETQFPRQKSWSAFIHTMSLHRTAILIGDAPGVDADEEQPLDYRVEMQAAIHGPALSIVARDSLAPSAKTVLKSTPISLDFLERTLSSFGREFPEDAPMHIFHGTLQSTETEAPFRAAIAKAIESGRIPSPKRLIELHNRNLRQLVGIGLDQAEAPADGIVEQTPGQPAVTRTAAAQRFIDKSKFEIARAAELGLELQPSVNGAYLYDPKAGRVVAAPRSKEYRDLLYGDQAGVASDAAQPAPAADGDEQPPDRPDVPRG